MTSSRRALRTCAALAAALTLALGGCSDAPTAPRADSTPTPGTTTPGSPSGSPTGSPTSSAPASATPRVRAPAAPERGACYRLSFADATHPTNRKHAVPCGQPHTAVTMYVGHLDLVVGGHAIGVDSDRAQRQVSRTCTAALPAYLGGTAQARQLSRFQVTWFSPTLRQSDAGAAWFRCDLVALGTGERLMRLPPRDALRHVLARPRALDTFGLCGTAQPGAPGFQRVPCAARHSWVAVRAIPLSGGARYPGVPAVRAAGDRTCAGVVRRRTGLALRFRYGWEWPTAAQWASGQHHGYCWAPSA